MTSGVSLLALDLIRPGPAQSRRQFTDAALNELAASIAESGVIQPVVVSGDSHHGYRLLAGERRWRAAQRAGLAVIPALIRNDLGAEQAAVLGLIENLQRESLGVIETAEGLARLAEAHALTHDAIAERIGKSRAYVTNFMRLRRLEPPVRALLEAGQLSLGHAKILAGLTGAEQTPLARRAAGGRMSVRQLEQAARRPPSAATADGAPGATAARKELAALEARLSEHVGNAVHIRYHPERRRGELTIEFHDLDEFDGLLARLGYSER